MKVNKVRNLGLLAFAVVGTAVMVGCAKKAESTPPEKEGVAERTGAAIDRAAEKAAEVATDVGTKTVEATKAAAEATQEAAGNALEKAGEMMEEAGEAAEEAGEDLPN